jgi:hypothetical protein
VTHIRATFYLIQFLLQRVALATFAFVAVGLLVTSVLAALGMLPWIQIIARWQGETVPNAGMYAQIIATVFAISLCFFLPSNQRIMALENSHRHFAVGMEDVARAYDIAHAADRRRTFNISSEFDAVKERLAYLRDHPDLSALEPEVLEIAAQMSHISKELAEVYSNDRVARARSFLTERQFEVDQFNARLTEAKAMSTELKHWMHEIELEESVAAAQLQRLRDELREVMPELGLETIIRTDNTVVELPPKAAE